MAMAMMMAMCLRMLERRQAKSKSKQARESSWQRTKVVCRPENQTIGQWNWTLKAINACGRGKRGTLDNSMVTGAKRDDTIAGKGVAKCRFEGRGRGKERRARVCRYGGRDYAPYPCTGLALHANKQSARLSTAVGSVTSGRRGIPTFNDGGTLKCGYVGQVVSANLRSRLEFGGRHLGPDLSS